MKCRWMAALLALMLALPPAAFAEPAWNFRGVSWGAFEEDIAEQEGRLADESRVLGEICLDLVYDGVTYRDHDNAQAAYILYDGMLVSAGYAVTEPSEEARAALVAAITAEHGQPNADGRLVFRTLYSLLSPEGESGPILQTAPTAWSTGGNGVLLYTDGDRVVLLYIGIDYLSAMDAEDDAGDPEAGLTAQGEDEEP